jgi:hypothetical protein
MVMVGANFNIHSLAYTYSHHSQGEVLPAAAGLGCCSGLEPVLDLRQDNLCVDVLYAVLHRLAC